MRPALCLLLAVTALGWSMPAAGAERQPRFLTFSAQDRNRVYLRNLKLPEVRLLIDGRPVDVSYLGYRNVETCFAFVIENSPRTAPHPMSMPQWGRVNLLDQVRYQLLSDYFDELVETGEVLLAEFAHSARIVQDFTRDEFRLQEAIVRMEPNFSELSPETIEVSRGFRLGLERLRSRPEKRKILTLVTTTVDRESYKNMQEYKEVLRASDVEFYVISFAPRFSSSGSATFEEKMNRFYFLNLVEETGGKLYLSGEYAFVSEFTGDLRTRLENSYTIGFYVEPGEEPRERAVKIEVSREKIEITHRKKIVY